METFSVDYGKRLKICPACGEKFFANVVYQYRCDRCVTEKRVSYKTKEVRQSSRTKKARVFVKANIDRNYRVVVDPEEGGFSVGAEFTGGEVNTMIQRRSFSKNTLLESDGTIFRVVTDKNRHQLEKCRTEPMLTRVR